MQDPPGVSTLYSNQTKTRAAAPSWEPQPLHVYVA